MILGDHEEFISLSPTPQTSSPKPTLGPMSSSMVSTPLGSNAFLASLPRRARFYGLLEGPLIGMLVAYGVNMGPT